MLALARLPLSVWAGFVRLSAVTVLVRNLACGNRPSRAGGLLAAESSPSPLHVPWQNRIMSSVFEQSVRGGPSVCCP